MMGLVLCMIKGRRFLGTEGIAELMCEYTHNVYVCSVPTSSPLLNRLSGGGSLLDESGPAQGFFPLTGFRTSLTEFPNQTPGPLTPLNRGAISQNPRTYIRSRAPAKLHVEGWDWRPVSLLGHWTQGCDANLKRGRFGLKSVQHKSLFPPFTQ